MTKNNSSSIITLAGLVLAIYALCNAEKITEGFGYGVAQGRVVVDRTVDCGSKRANTKGMGKVVPEYKWKQGDHDFSNIGYNEQLKRAFERQNQQQHSISRNSYYNEIADEEELIELEKNERLRSRRKDFSSDDEVGD
jgi:hypothetical protein